MSLKYIITEVTTEVGADLSNPDIKDYWIDKVNRAARELHEQYDLPGSLLEQAFYVDNNDASQITLPWYVDNIRLIRLLNPSYPVAVHDMVPRYETEGWNGKSALDWREKGIVSLARSLSNASILKFTIPKAESADIKINIAGSTVLAFRASEQVIIPAGQLSASSVNNWTDTPTNIEKSSHNNYDITILDVNDTELGRIAASELSSRYLLIQIRDFYLANLITQAVEVLFKSKFLPLRFDYDVFQCNVNPDLVVWKTLEHYFARKPGMEGRAVGFKSKCDDMIRQIMENKERGKKFIMDFGNNRYRNLVDFSDPSSYTTRRNWRY